MEKHIINGLEKFINSENVPWHMPGHKRRISGNNNNNIDITSAIQMISDIDVTEVEETDDLHHPENIIKNSLEDITNIYGTYRSYYMINGSTGGILAAISACSIGINRQNKNIIMARNCHKSVYNAVELLGLNPIFLDDIRDEKYKIPGHIDVENIERICKKIKNVCCMVITSPTYEGVLSDVIGIKSIIAKYNIPLIVDEAHGAHLPFANRLPKSAINCGADIVIQSLHKTLSALTQTAIIHVNNDAYDESVRKYLSVYMSSSPSYVFLCSMEYSINRAINSDYNEYVDNIEAFIKSVDTLNNISIYKKEQALENGAYDYDISRIVLYSNKINGPKLEKLLRKNNIIIEMSTVDYVVLISTVEDKKEDFDNLFYAINNIDIEIEKLIEKENGNNTFNDFSNNIQQLDNELNKLIGKKAADNIYVYPPGSYIVRVGEEYTEDKINIIKNNMLNGKKIRGKLL